MERNIQFLTNPVSIFTISVCWTNSLFIHSVPAPYKHPCYLVTYLIKGEIFSKSLIRYGSHPAKGLLRNIYSWQARSCIRSWDFGEVTAWGQGKAAICSPSAPVHGTCVRRRDHGSALAPCCHCPKTPGSTSPICPFHSWMPLPASHLPWPCGSHPWQWVSGGQAGVGGGWVQRCQLKDPAIRAAGKWRTAAMPP